MAVINCPECKDKMSDTLKSCPHCGFVVKKNEVNLDFLKKIDLSKFKKDTKKEKEEKISKDSNVLDKIKYYSLKVVKNKFVWIGLVVILLVGVVVINTLSNKVVKMTEAMIEYLEDEDYDCDYIDRLSYGSGYVCVSDKKTGVIKKYTLMYSNDFFSRIGEETAVDFTYVDDEYGFRLHPFRGTVMLNALEEGTTDIADEGFNSDVHYDIRSGKAEYSECHDYSGTSLYSYEYARKCRILNSHYSQYAGYINEAIEEMEDLFDEADLDIEWESA